MALTTVVKSFADLPRLLNLDDLPPGPDDPGDAQPPQECIPDDVIEPAAQSEAPIDLADLLAELEAASATLAAVARHDEETRAVALRDLERYDAVAATLHQAELVQSQACQLHDRAAHLFAEAFATEAKVAAERVVTLTERSAAVADRLATERRAELEQLAAELDLERLLAERRRQEEVEAARAAEAERAGRLSGALAEASEALQSGRIEEARALAGLVCTEDPDNADAASLITMIAQRPETVILQQVEYRDTPFLLHIGAAPDDRLLVERDVDDARGGHGVPFLPMVRRTARILSTLVRPRTPPSHSATSFPQLSHRLWMTGLLRCLPA